MTITAANIEAAVQDRTNITVSSGSVNSEIVRACIEITGKVPNILETSGSVVIAINENSIAVPTGFVRRQTLTDSNQVPLNWCETLGELQSKFEGSITAGTPKHWTIFERKVYVYPSALVETTLTLYYCYRDTAAGTITLPDPEAFNALVEWVCHEKELARGVPGEIVPDAVTHLNLFERQIGLLQAIYGVK